MESFIKDRLVSAFSVLFESFYIKEHGLFREAIGNPKPGDPPFAYNWSFGALLTAFAALLESGAVTDHPMRESWENTLASANDRYLTLTRGLFGYDSYIDQKNPVRYYDDNAWIGLASLRLFEQTGRAAWIQRAVIAYQFVRDGWDHASDGVFWRESPRRSLHVCSAGPGALLAGQLYSHTREEEQLDCARRWFAWTLKLRNADGVFQDNLNPETGVIEPKTFTYNQGTPLHAALVLHEQTGDAAYRVEAERILRAANHFLQPEDRSEDAEGRSNDAEDRSEDAEDRSNDAEDRSEDAEDRSEDGGRTVDGVRGETPRLPRTIWFNAVLLRAVAAAARRGLSADGLIAAYDRELAAAWDAYSGVRPLVGAMALDSPPGRLPLLDAAGTMEMAATRAEAATSTP